MLSGLLLTAAFPHLDQGWLAWFALVPFLISLPTHRPRAAIAHGATFGLFYFGGVLYWVGLTGAHALGNALGIVSWLIATLAQVSVVILFTIGAYFFKRTGSVWAWRLGVPALWTLFEWMRQCGSLGTGWGGLGYTQHAMLPILQLARLTGVWGLTFLIVLVNVALTELASTLWIHRHVVEPNAELSPGAMPVALDRHVLESNAHNEAGPGVGPGATSIALDGRVLKGSDERGPGAMPSALSGHVLGPISIKNAPLRFLLIVVLVVLASVVYGFIALHTERLHPNFTAAALQADINPNIVWSGPRPQDPNYVTQVMTAFAAQSREAAKRGATLVVWPEGTFPGYLRDDPELRAALLADAARNHQVVLVGGREYDYSVKKDANTLFLLLPDGQIEGAYRKRQLVPFGEFIPGRRWLPFLNALHLTLYDMTPGSDPQPLLDAGVPIGRVGAMICYESSYPRLSQEQMARGAGLLVIVTDDTWYERTAAARQHTAMAAVRAVESDRYVIRAAATGVSQIISPTGQVLDEAPLFVPKVVLASIESRTTITPSVRWPEWFVVLCGGIVAWAGIGVVIGRQMPRQ